MKPVPDTNKTITWEAPISLLSSRVVIRQLLFAFGAGAVFLLLLLTAIHAFDGDLTLSTFLTALLIAAAVFAGLSLLVLLVLLLFYGNKYEYRYTVNAQGVLSETTGNTLKKNTVANFLLALSGRPGPTGAGLMAQSRQSEEVKWGSVSRFTNNPARHEIVLYCGLLASMVIACTAENFESILEIVEKSIKP